MQSLRKALYSCTARHCFSTESNLIFDTTLKALHRDRAAHLLSSSNTHKDPLLTTVAERLVDRLEDCTRPFPHVLVLGGAGLEVLTQLRGGRAGVEKATYVDTSPGMLQRAEHVIKQSSTIDTKGKKWPEVEYIQASTEKELLPVEPDMFDAVISCLGLHWVNDIPTYMLQCRFALHPDRLFLAAMLGGDTLQELRIACTIAQQEREGGLSPRLSPLARVRDAGNLLTRTGLSLPTVDVDDVEVQYGDGVVGLVEHLRMMGEGGGLMLQRREALRRDTALASAAIYHTMFSNNNNNNNNDNNSGEGSPPSSPSSSSSSSSSSVVGTYQVIYMTGWSPDSSQPKAAKRGSATVSFQDLSKDLGGGG